MSWKPLAFVCLALALAMLGIIIDGWWGAPLALAGGFFATFANGRAYHEGRMNVYAEWARSRTLDARDAAQRSAKVGEARSASGSAERKETP